MKFSGKVANGPVNNRLNFGGDPGHRLHTGIVFQIRHYCEIRKVVSINPCSAGHVLAGIAHDRQQNFIATLVRRALVEVCNVPVLLVFITLSYIKYTLKLSVVVWLRTILLLLLLLLLLPLCLSTDHDHVKFKYKFISFLVQNFSQFVKGAGARVHKYLTTCCGL